MKLEEVHVTQPEAALAGWEGHLGGNLRHLSSGGDRLSLSSTEVPRLADSVDLATLGLASGEARTLALQVRIDELAFGGQTYSAGGHAEVRLGVSRTMSGYALRLRLDADLSGPCMRCLEDAGHTVEVDALEIDQPGDAEELRSPYVADSALDLRGWARDALELPPPILCRDDCLGLCVRCGANLNRDPGHVHQREPDPRWANLSELRTCLRSRDGRR